MCILYKSLSKTKNEQEKSLTAPEKNRLGKQQVKSIFVLECNLNSSTCKIKSNREIFFTATMVWLVNSPVHVKMNVPGIWMWMWIALHIPFGSAFLPNITQRHGIKFLKITECDSIL